MFNLKCENEAGNVIDFSHEDKYILTNVDGLNPPKSSVVVDSIPNMDGGLYRTSKMQTRNIVLTFAIKAPIEQNRLDAYRVFRSKRYIKIYIQTRALNVYTEGYVESIECNNFAKGQKMQVSIICPDAYFKNINPLIIEMNKEIDALEFPFFTVNGNPVAFNDTLNATATGDFIVFNQGDVETGFELKVRPKDGYYFTYFMITDKTTGKYIFISRQTSSVISEYLTIKTAKGEKGVFTTYINPETSEKITKSIVDQCIITDFFQVDSSENNFNISVGIIPEGYTEKNTEATEETPAVPRYTDEDTHDFIYENTGNGVFIIGKSASIQNMEIEMKIDERWQGI